MYLTATNVHCLLQTEVSGKGDVQEFTDLTRWQKNANEFMKKQIAGPLGGGCVWIMDYFWRMKISLGVKARRGPFDFL